jgi:hypothetical protein
MSFNTGWHTGTVRSGTEEMEQIASKPSPEDLRTFINNEMQNADDVVARKRAADDFVAMYKPRGYKDTTANGKQVQNALLLLGKTKPTIADFEDIYARLVANGMLDLDQSKLTALQKQEEAARIKQHLDNQFSEEAAYVMPLNEVYKRGMGW